MRIYLLSLCLAVGAKAQTPESVKSHIIRWEGYSHHSYHDKGHLAIGIGHRFKSGERRAAYWTDAQINRAFEQDLAIARVGAQRAVIGFDAQPEPIRIIIIALTFNCGVAGFHQFYAFRAALARHDYDEAARQLRKSLWARQLQDRADEYVATLISFQRPRFVLPTRPAS